MRVAAHSLLTALVLLGTAGCTGQTGGLPVNGTPQISVIPQPASVEMLGGTFTPAAGFVIQADAQGPETRAVAEYLAAKLEQAAGSKPAIAPFDGGPAHGAVVLRILPAAEDLGSEGYALRVESDHIVIEAPQSAGLFYGVQTLLQLLPSGRQPEGSAASADWAIPCVSIRDWPRYPYRGMHLDVCRHFFGPQFIKRYLDLLALHKMNTFHWHLTEDQGWRIAIEKYPRLTEVGGFRRETLIGHYSDQPHRFDGTRYGGFYTQDEVREIVRYAQERFITVIPEIEMPGHSLAAISAHPELSCTGGPFEPATKWGVFEDVYCAGNEAVFAFLEDVLAEVVALFPGPYVHIGGDECPKARWEACPRCQARIRAEGLEDEHELQSYFIRRIESVLLGHGKRLIGWDEIFEGGLAPNATVMSWRGMQGGIDAADQGHDVIMTPGSHCYFDHYQADPETEPLAIGGLTTLKKVHSFEPTPPQLDETAARHVLGAQGNMWTEYIDAPQKVEYMSMPRMCALAEVVWSPADTRDWGSFLVRLDRHFDRLDDMKVNYSRGSFEVKIVSRFDAGARRTLVALETERLDAKVRYTLDGSEPGLGSPLYGGPLRFDRSMTVKAAIVSAGDAEPAMERVASRVLRHHLAVDKEIELGAGYAPRYAGGGDRALIDGFTGSDHYGDGSWQGYEEVDLEATIDLGAVVDIHRVVARFLGHTRVWIFLPKRIEVELSLDRQTWTATGAAEPGVPDDHQPVEARAFSFGADGARARYVRVKAANVGECPPWHSGAGGKTWIFADEVIVE